MNPSKKAIVIGGSIGGLFAANLLLRAGWDVHIYEQVAAELESRGAGIVTHPELLDALREAGVVVDASLGIHVQERITLNTDGSRIGTLHYPQILTAWGRLFALLSAAFPAERYHAGKVLSAFHQDSNSVTAQFADGESVSADLLIAADGLRSIVRQTLVANASPHYAGYIAWRGMVEESVLSERALKEMFPYFAFGLPEHEQMIAYPVAGKNNTVEPGKRRYNFVWYRPADEATTLRDMVTDASGKIWPDGIPPPLIQAHHLAHARTAARQVLAPQFAEMIEKTEHLFFQPVFDLESNQLAFGRIALLGDAAFVARPHVGMGVTKAAEDARSLVRELAAHDDLSTALDQYQTARLTSGKYIVARARGLGAYMQAQISTPHERAMAEKYRSAEMVMAETAVSLRGS
jgi:2-polyprenyl-6-methoxyphenol hydroxylase-like FAD-dependent oxidoreductase